MIKHYFLLLFAVPFTIQADDSVFQVDLTPCIEQDCMANELAHDFKPASNIEVYTGYNIVHWKDRGSKLYPLFQIYNRQGKPIDIKVGLQLLNDKGIVILEMIGYKTLHHTDKKEHTYETYVPLNAGSVNKEILNNTVSMKVIFKEERL